MPLVRFRKPRPEIVVDRGANLMTTLLKAGVPVASSCRGEGVCTKCRVEIVSGEENLSAESALELSQRQRLSIPANERLSCQAQVLGDVTVDTGYW